MGQDGKTTFFRRPKQAIFSYEQEHKSPELLYFSRGFRTKPLFATVTAGDPVSLLEIYLDFSISQKMMTPVLLPTGLKNSKGRMIKKYELRHRNLLADDQPCDLASQSKVWHACISWFWKQCGHTPGHIVPKCSSLAKYGYSIPCKGLSCGVILNRPSGKPFIPIVVPNVTLRVCGVRTPHRLLRQEGDCFAC